MTTTRNMYKLLKSFIEKYTDLPSSEWQIIEKAFHKNEYKKDTMLLTEGNICGKFYFIESGIVRFFYNVDGNEITKVFTVAPYCFTSKTSFIKQEIANESIQVIDNAIIWETTYSNYKELESLNSWRIFIQKILAEVQEFAENFHLASKTKTAEIRYQKFCERYHPGIIQKIPLKYISSFLGIAPQSLSRIRKKSIVKLRKKLT